MMTKKVIFNSTKYLPVKMFGQEFFIREDFYTKLMLSMILGQSDYISLLTKIGQELNKLNDIGDKPLELKD